MSCAVPVAAVAGGDRGSGSSSAAPTTGVNGAVLRNIRVRLIFGLAANDMH